MHRHHIGMKRFIQFLLTLLFTASLTLHAAERTTQRVDVCVYRATPTGIVTAVFSAGIKPMQDCAKPVAVGGLTTTRKEVSMIEAKVFIEASYEGDVMAAALITPCSRLKNPHLILHS
jgi:hypothetical protein